MNPVLTNDRFEVVAVRPGPITSESDEAIGYRLQIGASILDIVVLHYDSHFDARLGADGVRTVGYLVAGIRDRESDTLVDHSPVKGRI